MVPADNIRSQLLVSSSPVKTSGSLFPVDTWVVSSKSVSRRTVSSLDSTVSSVSLSDSVSFDSDSSVTLAMSLMNLLRETFRRLAARSISTMLWKKMERETVTWLCYSAIEGNRHGVPNYLHISFIPSRCYISLWDLRFLLYGIWYGSQYAAFQLFPISRTVSKVCWIYDTWFTMITGVYREHEYIEGDYYSEHLSCEWKHGPMVVTVCHITSAVHVSDGWLDSSARYDHSH